MRIDMMQIGGSDVLAGALAGQEAFPRFVSCLTASAPRPEAIFLDFSLVKVATASYLRETVLALRDYTRSRKSTLYPVVANASEIVIDELNALLETKNDALLVCDWEPNQTPKNVRIIGGISSVYRDTLSLVFDQFETDANKLSELEGLTSGIGLTGWNNRLSLLSRLGLVIERTEGKSKRYRSVLPEVEHGG